MRVRVLIQDNRQTVPRVLVTGVGGGVGQSVLKALQDAPVETVAANADPRAAGLFAASRSYLVPNASTDPPDSFLEAILAICTSEEIDLVVPAIEPELAVFARAASDFASIGTQVLVSSPRVIAIGDDKYSTSQFLAAHGLPAPETQLLSPDGVIDRTWFPVVVKPRLGGARSQGVHAVRHTRDWDRIRDSVDINNTIVQELIEGEEYTCGTVTFGGKCFGSICMQRELRAGDTYRARVVVDEELEQFTRELVETLRPHGPCNIQLRLRNGVPYVFELNPRCSGTTAARALAGFNEPLAAVSWLLEGREPVLERRPMVVFRYWSEVALDTNEFERFRCTGYGTFPRRL